MKWLLVTTACLLSAVSGFSQEKGIHLFILSGQSNMQGHRPDEAFTPAVEKALGKENVLVIQDALGGQPILRWYKQWTDPSGAEPKEQRGDLYDRLMKKVKPAIEDKEIASVTFFWMQGERDAKMSWGPVYQKSLRGLYDQLSADLGREDMNFVIGRLSDFDMENKRYPHWTVVREAQVALADSAENFVWVDTDDLNDGKNRKGKEIKDDLHYSGEGYKEFGRRMAKEALQMIEADK